MKTFPAIKARPRLPTWAVALCSIVGTLLAAALVTGLLLGKEGLSMLQGWLLAKYAFVETDADLGAASNQALSGLITGLGDRWSYYISPERYDSLRDSRANRYLGIGVTVSYEDERGLLVKEVTEGGPAYTGGVTAGEIITAVDGHDLSGDGQEQGTQYLSGQKGEKRLLTLLSPDGATRQVELTLDYVHLWVVKGELLDCGAGLITIRNFNTGAADEFRAAVESLTRQGANALIFDLRGNGGGYLDQMVQMLDLLLPKGDVFQSQPRWWFPSVMHSDESCVSLPFGALVNGDTYSAAELFAAQLRESVNAPIVGEATCGKGYSQNTFRLFNGGAIGISTARYTTGSGVSLIGTGITPDLEAALAGEASARRASYTLPPAEDAQLQALLNLMGL